MPKAVNHFDFGGFEARNVVLQNLSAAPSSPAPGRIFYGTNGAVPYYWNGAAWRPMDAAALADGSIQISALAKNPLDRGNHFGTQTANTISDLAATVQGYRLDQFAAPAAAVSWGAQRITNLAPGTAATDAINLQQLTDGLSNALAGIDPKPSVRVYASANITRSGPQTIDGVTAGIGDRVLLGGQTDGTQNGSYVVAAGAWTRGQDADQSGEITPGSEWFVEEGITYKATKWRVANTGTITIGTTPIVMVQSAAANVYSAGFGLSLTGSVFAVQLASGSGLTATASGLALDPSVVARKFSATIPGDGTTSSFTITHNLGTQDVSITLRDASNALLLADVVAATNSTVTVSFGAAPASGTNYRATVIG